MVTSTRFTRGIAAQHCLSWHYPEGQGVGQSSPKDPFLPGVLTWGSPSPWQGTLGQKDSANALGTLQRQRTLQGWGGVQLHPGSILPPHAGGPEQSSPSPSSMHTDPKAKG